MEGLRLVLLVVGVLVVAGVYFHTRSSSRRGRAGIRDALEPTMTPGDRRVADDELPDDLPPLHAAAPEVGDDGEAPDETPATAASKPRNEKIIVLNIMPVETGETFPGADLLDVFDRAGLEYGQFGVFHRVRESAEGPTSVFSVASATEPGSFDITAMAEERFRGLSFFMLLPGPVHGVDAFADMLATARRIAEQIRGEVTDHNRSTLTRQTARHLREEIVAFEHQLATTRTP